MKVRELIDKLRDEDPELEVVLQDPPPDEVGWLDAARSIESIERAESNDGRLIWPGDRWFGQRQSELPKVIVLVPA